MFHSAQQLRDQKEVNMLQQLKKLEEENKQLAMKNAQLCSANMKLIEENQQLKKENTNTKYQIPFSIYKHFYHVKNVYIHSTSELQFYTNLYK